MTGTWRAVAAGWPVFLPVVVVNALAQWVTTIPGATPLGAASLALAVGGGIVLTLAIALVAAAAQSGVARHPFAWPRLALVGWSVITVLVLFGATALSPLLAPVVLLAAAFGLPAVANGARTPLAGFTVFARRPARSIIASLGFLLATALLWVAAVAFGLFVTGFAGSVTTWLVFGVAGVVLLCAWTALLRPVGD